MAEGWDAQLAAWRDGVHEVLHWWHGLERIDAVDELHHLAESHDLPAHFGEDVIQQILAEETASAAAKGSGSRTFAQACDAPDWTEPAPEQPRDAVNKTREYPGANNGAQANGGDQAGQRFTLKRFAEIKLSTARNYLIKGLLPRSGLAVIWGQPKCGKSFIAFDMAMHIAVGRDYRGRRVQRGVVVYCALEGGGGFAARVEAWRKCKLTENDPRHIPFCLLDVPLDLIAECVALVASIRTQVAQPSVVFIDTLNRALVGDENSSADMGDLVRAAGAISAAFGCLVVLIHHCGVAGNRPRGHTSLEGADDAQIAVARNKDGVITVTIEHMKDSEIGPPFACKLEQVKLGKDDDGDLMTSCIVLPEELLEDEQKPEAKGPKLTGAAKVAYDALWPVMKQHGQPAREGSAG
jgi:hypothetical protein